MLKMINRPNGKKYCLYLDHEELFTLVTLLGLSSPSSVDKILHDAYRIDEYFKTDECADLVNENIWNLYQQITESALRWPNIDKYKTEFIYTSSKFVNTNVIYNYMKDNNLIDFNKKGDDSDE